MPRLIDKSQALRLLAVEREALLTEDHDCLLCALVRRAVARSDVIAENEQGVVLLDRFGSREGHLIIVSRRHVEKTTALAFAEYVELQRLAYEACVAIERCLAPLRTFVAVLGASDPVPMSFPHFHIHVLPVYEAGEAARPANVLSWTTSGVLVYEDSEARALVARLREAWPAAPAVAESARR